MRAGQVLADAAALGPAHHRAPDELRAVTVQLETALAGRVLIEQVEGLLSGRLGITPDATFDLMCRHARARQMKMTEPTRRILTAPPGTGPFPGPSPAPPPHEGIPR